MSIHIQNYIVSNNENITLDIYFHNIDYDQNLCSFEYNTGNTYPNI